MPEPINSVVVGDPSSFSAEHSDREPNLVFVKPITPKVAQTNLLISSTRLPFRRLAHTRLFSGRPDRVRHE